MGLALLQVLWHYRMIRSRSRAGCFKAFRLNHWLGFTVFLGIALALARLMAACAPQATQALPYSSPMATARCRAACMARTKPALMLSCSIDVMAAWVVPPAEVTR